jgi:hypothetical protein
MPINSNVGATHTNGCPTGISNFLSEIFRTQSDTSIVLTAISGLNPRGGQFR